MITIYPLKYIELQKYYRSLTFTLNELSLLLNVKGFYKGKQIDKNIAISKNRLYTSKTVLNNSLTLFYTFVRADLDDFTYISSNITFNSIDPDKPEFLLYLDDDYNCVNASITLLSNTIINNTIVQSTSSVYSYSSEISNLSYTSLTALYSLTAEYCKNINVTSSNIDVYNIPYTRIFVTNDFNNMLLTMAKEYDSFYNINTKKLYVYINKSWQEVDWKPFIKSDRLYKEGRLRINDTTGALEIANYPVDEIWFEIIPTIGKAFEPIDSTGYVYYIAPGQIYNEFGTATIPIIAVNSMMFSGMYYNYSGFSGSSQIGLLPSNMNVIYNGSGMYCKGGAIPLQTDTIYSGSTIPIACVANDVNNYASFNIYIYNDTLFVTSVARSDTGPVISTVLGSGDFLRNGYYLGTLYYDNVPTNLTMLTVKREL
jgi:hypothetical protein